MHLFTFRLYAIVRALLRDPQSRGLVLITFVVIAVGTIFYRFIEGLSWVDALYFTMITLTTVGYGDISPQTTAGKLFTIVYIIVGLGIIATFIGLVAEKQRDFATSAPPRDADPPSRA